MKTCVICDKPIPRLRSNNAKTCSPQCRYQLQLAYKRTPKARGRENARRRAKGYGRGNRLKERPPCRQCGMDISHRDGRASLCESCSRLNELDNLRSARIKTKYGITWDERIAMQKSQSDCCWACGDPLKPHGKKRLAGERTLGVIDHCHDTGAVRGILCSPCNSVEGHIKNGRVAMLEVYLAKSQRKK